MNYVIRIDVGKSSGYIDVKARATLYIANDYFCDDSLLSEIVSKKFSRAFIFKTEEHVMQYMRNHIRRIFEIEDAIILKFTDEELFLERLKDDA